MRAPQFRDTHISLAHGNGGRLMRELIEELFVPALANPQLDTGADAVALPIPADRDLVITTDGFTVQPLEFPGGNIGSLAVHGTVNDLAVSGARTAREQYASRGWVVHHNTDLWRATAPSWPTAGPEPRATASASRRSLNSAHPAACSA